MICETILEYRIFVSTIKQKVMFTKIELVERLVNARNNQLIGYDGPGEYMEELTNDFIEYWMSIDDRQFVNDYVHQSGVKIRKIGFDQFDLDYDISLKNKYSYNRYDA